MRLALFGLGRMGGNMARRLIQDGHEVVAWDPKASAVEAVTEDGALPADSLEAAVGMLEPPKVCWVMAPIGEPTDSTLTALADLLKDGDILVDGGNSDPRDTNRRIKDLQGPFFVDCGVSGGLHGLERGYCLMVGGTVEAYEILKPALKSLATENGFRHVGPVGAGHYSKMIHNAIEYGIMQAYAEGLNHLQKAPQKVDVAGVAELWRHGSVVSSWLLDLLAQVLDMDPELKAFEGKVGKSGEGDWAAREAARLGVDMPALKAALDARASSKEKPNFSTKILSALRAAFGGHREPPV